MNSTENSIVIEGLKKSYGKVEVLKGVNLTIRKGEVLGLLGPNGAGKTTTVRILSTLLKPDAGTLSIAGHDVVKEPDKVRAIIGLTGQYAAVDELLSGRENLVMMARLFRLSKEDCKKRAQELLEQFELTDAADRAVKTYSGGMRRRLDLAVSLIASPDVLFLDEPTTGLDPHSRLALWETIKKLAAGETTILLTTQHMEEADYLADRIVVIDKGRVIAEGTPLDLKAQVGADRLEVTLAQGADFEKAVEIIDGEIQSKDAKRRVIEMITTNGVSDLKQVLARLESANISVENVSLHRPTLDDVFLKLTGHEATQDETEKKGEKK